MAGVYLSEAQGVYLSEAQNPIPSPPPYTLYIQYTCIHYTVYLFTQGRGEGGGELNQREGERGNSSQSWVENSNNTDFISSL